MDLRVAQRVGEARHVTLVAATDDGGSAFLYDAEQHIVGMVPSVAVGIMRRRRQPSGRKRRAPVGLALQIRAMAGGAPIDIDLPTLRNYFLGCRCGGRNTGVLPSSEDREDQYSGKKSDPESIGEDLWQNADVR